MSRITPEEHREPLKDDFNQSHAFLIGINSYKDLPPLKTAVNDVEKLAEVLEKKQSFTVFPPLYDATKEDIEKLLNETLPQTIKSKKDRVVFYFAGHGVAADSDEKPEGFIIPADARPFDDSSFIPMQTLHAAIKKLPCKHLLVVLDCCFSGAFSWSSRYRDITTRLPKRIFKERFDRFVKDNAWQVITSSAYDQRA
ncbi:MAG: caspase family protein, partial [Okeania sp. SIO3B3]|nr:caspase family protein [Okeania sp. SIO3B3]